MHAHAHATLRICATRSSHGLRKRDARGSHYNNATRRVIHSRTRRYDHAASDALGIHGQCCLLVRPDAHVALRCEPLRPPVVYRYLRDTLGASAGVPAAPSYFLGDGAPASAPVFDWLPSLLWLALLGGGVALLALGHSATVHVCLEVPVAYLVASGTLLLGLLVMAVNVLASPARE